MVTSETPANLKFSDQVRILSVVGKGPVKSKREFQEAYLVQGVGGTGKILGVQ